MLEEVSKENRSAVITIQQKGKEPQELKVDMYSLTIKSGDACSLMRFGTTSFFAESIISEFEALVQLVKNEPSTSGYLLIIALLEDILEEAGKLEGISIVKLSRG